MEWIQNDADFLTAFGAVLAVGTALLGLAVGLGQFTGASRARRTIEWTSSALESEKDAARIIILERLKLRGQGYLVAAQYIPGWRFAGAVAWTLVAPTTVILGASRGGELLSLAASILSGLVTLALVGRRTIRLFAERMRVAHQFALGGMEVEPVRMDILAQMEGGTRREYSLGFVCAASVMSAGGLIAWALVEGRDSTVWLWLIVAAVACWSCLQLVRSYATRWSEKQPANLPA
jgi:hypothetical protein